MITKKSLTFPFLKTIIPTKTKYGHPIPPPSQAEEVCLISKAQMQIHTDMKTQIQTRRYKYTRQSMTILLLMRSKPV